jgi:hypothetical protein
MPSDNKDEGFVTHHELAQCLTHSERRVRDDLEEHIITMINTHVDSALESRLLTEEERQWVKLAVKHQSQQIALRQAIIDKTLTALIWATIVGIGTFVWQVGIEWATKHGFKP